ncbi:MAG: CHAP domain-containing protein, partial [Myxococcota bacterium]
MKATLFAPLLTAVLLGSAALLQATPAHAVYQCGDTTDDCICGADNPFPCCDNGGNCTWYAWHAACCNWGVVVPMLGNANTWAGVAASDPNYEVLPHPVPNSIACRVSGSYGHVAWVKQVNGSSIVVDEMNCWGNYGVREWTYDASYFDGGYIVLAGSQCECTSGEEASRDCGDCGTETRQCGSDCMWGPWSACDGPDPGGACDTGLLGACASGELRCVEGNTQCGETTSPAPETCDDVDNDCDGEVDEDGVCGSAGAAGGGGAAGSGAGGAGGATSGTGGSTSGTGGSTGGTGGSGGTAGNWPSTDGGAQEAGSASDYYASEEPDGCACRAAGGSRNGHRAGWLALLLGLWISRRRRSATP